MAGNLRDPEVLACKCSDFLCEAWSGYPGRGHEERIQHDFQVQLMHIPEERLDHVIAPSVVQQQEADLGSCHKSRYLYMIIYL